MAIVIFVPLMAQVEETHIFTIKLYIEIVHHSNYRSTSIIEFSKIFIFLKIDKIFSCKFPSILIIAGDTIRGNTVDVVHVKHV